MQRGRPPRGIEQVLVRGDEAEQGLCGAQHGAHERLGHPAGGDAGGAQRDEHEAPQQPHGNRGETCTKSSRRSACL